MKTIPLTQGKVAIVDNGEYDILNRFNWYALHHGRCWYAVRRIRLENGKQTSIYMHRQLMNFPTIGVDHKNANGLDNRRKNLRLANTSQNQANRRMGCNNSSGFKGVSWHKGSKKWEARIQIRGERLCLGLFVDPKEAFGAYIQSSVRNFGEYARAR